MTEVVAHLNKEQDILNLRRETNVQKGSFIAISCFFFYKTL